MNSSTVRLLVTGVDSVFVFHKQETRTTDSSTTYSEDHAVTDILSERDIHLHPYMF